MKSFKYTIIFIVAFVGLILLAYLIKPVTQKTTQSKTFVITGSTFDRDVMVVVTQDTAYAAKYVRENLDSVFTSKDFDARAVTFGFQRDRPIIVWLSDAEDKGVVAHELFHATSYIMYWAGMELQTETEEAFAYQLQYLTNQFYNQINKTE
jgi:hypothetical protein